MSHSDRKCVWWRTLRSPLPIHNSTLLSWSSTSSLSTFYRIMVSEYQQRLITQTVCLFVFKKKIIMTSNIKLTMADTCFQLSIMWTLRQNRLIYPKDSQKNSVHSYTANNTHYICRLPITKKAICKYIKILYLKTKEYIN